MKITNKSKKIINKMLGFSAAWYLATYLFFTGIISSGPYLITGLIALITLTNKDDICHKNVLRKNVRWSMLLIAFGLFSIFSVYIHDAEIHLYEIPLKFLIGGIIALAVSRSGIDFTYIKVGVFCGMIGLIALFLFKYDGQYRFSPFMNATKWGGAVTFQTLLSFSIALIEKKLARKIIFLLLGITGVYLSILIGTRGAWVPIVGYSALAIYIYFFQANTKKIVRLTSLTVFFLLIIGVASSNSFQQRIEHTLSDFKEMKADNYLTSIGVRLTMWHAGLQSTIRNPLFGKGYELESVLKEYDAPSPGLRKAADFSSTAYRLFHNAYIDTMVTKGFIGLIILLSLLYVGIREDQFKRMLLMAPPILGVGMVGLTDSSLALGITSSYLIIAGTILKSVKNID